MKNETFAKIVKGGVVLLGTAVSALIAACIKPMPEDDVIDVTNLTEEPAVEDLVPAEEVSETTTE